MPVTRHFLGWDRPLTETIRDWLIPSVPDGPVDLEQDLIVVPTRHAGRRLSDALACYCGEHGTALLSCRTVTPAVLLRDDPSPAGLADDLDTKRCWLDVLAAIKPDAFPGLFPHPPPTHDTQWALRTAATLQSLRGALCEAGLTLRSLVESRLDDLEEPGRWQDLAALENAYLAALRDAGLTDPLERRLALAMNPVLAADVQRVVLAAVPDPMGLAVTALERLAAAVEIAILVPAPESEADTFDDWGRPLPSAWIEAPIDIAEADIVPAADPIGQARCVLDTLAAEAGRFTANDLAVGAPDATLCAYLAAAFAEHGMTTFNPADRPLRDRALYRLVEAWAGLIDGGTYGDLATFLRHPDVLDCLNRQQTISPLDLLTELDTFQNQRLPWTLQSAAAWLDGADAAAYPALAAAVRQIGVWLTAHDGANLAASLRGFLQGIYAHRTLSADRPEDEDFEEAARRVDDVLHAWERAAGRGRPPAAAGLPLLLRHLADQVLPARRGAPAIDLDGWLELPWNDAPLMVVTGMNEGAVPDSRFEDVFLPDSLRTRLGMRDDTRRLARDCFLTRLLVESRRAAGRVRFVCGKTSAAGDPLKPSRILLHCPDADLPERARRLFGPAPRSRPTYPASISFPLNPAPPPDLPDGALPLRRVHVTAFRDYLACPFRFYLKHVLEMEALDDSKRAPDALDFGIMVHSALQALAAHRTLSRSDDPDAVAGFLCRQAGRWVDAHFGQQPSLPIRMSLDAARQRLRAAAQVQAGLVQAGWEIVASEQTFERDMGGLTVRGTIDRIDRHRDSGQMRVIDYKTSDTPAAPDSAHLRRVRDDTPEYAQVKGAKGPSRWIDLQLPLYLLLADNAGAAPAYFNLPKAVGDTALTPWETFDPGLLDSARQCAEAVAGRIRDQVFWPPAERVEHDDFESLFPLGIENALTPLNLT